MLGLHAHICRLIREGNQPPKKGMLCIVGNFWLRCWCERDNLIANSSPIFLAGREIGNATIELAVWKATCAWISHAWQSQNNNGGDIFPHARTYSIFGHAMPCISFCGAYPSKQNTPPKNVLSSVKKFVSSADSPQSSHKHEENTQPSSRRW